MEHLQPPPLNFERDTDRYSPDISSSSDYAWRTFVFVIFGLLAAVGVIWLAYTLFLKDCILVWKAKRQRRTEEIGYGNTPVRQNGNEGIQR